MLLPEGNFYIQLEEDRSVTSVAAEFRIAHSIVSRLWRQFQTTGTAIRRFSSGRPRGTTPADDRYLVLQARKTGGRQRINRQTHDTGDGRPISRFTVARRPHGGGLFARHPVRCTFNASPIRERVLCGAGNTGIGETMNGNEYSFTDDSRFSFSSDSHRILIWSQREAAIIPRTPLKGTGNGGRGVLAWGGIVLGSRIYLHIFDAGSVNGTRYCNEILLPYVRLLEALWVCSSFSWTAMHHVIAQ
ncbi:transposable element Tcb1 transposase [Trichonephila clavipes]|nr:transposable element Tcb1 transposase [Trichonephila clavipes]